MKPCTTLAALAALALAAGCASFRSTQKDAFVDDDGNILVVEYGSLSRSYAYKLVSPINGAEVECTDNRAVRVTLPDETGAPNGETMTLRICQNDSPKGTTYATKDGKWKYWTIGYMSRLYLWYPAEGEYIFVFGGKSSPSVLEGGR